METGPNRWYEFIGALTFTIPIGVGLALLCLTNVWIGSAAITLAVTAALLIRAT